METLPQTSLEDTLAFIRKWLEHGDLKDACERFQIDKSIGSKYLNGKLRRPKVEFLAYLKKKAVANYNKLRI